MKMKKAVTAKKAIAGFSAERRKRIVERAAELITMNTKSADGQIAQLKSPSKEKSSS